MFKFSCDLECCGCKVLLLQITVSAKLVPLDHCKRKVLLPTAGISQALAIYRQVTISYPSQLTQDSCEY